MNMYFISGLAADRNIFKHLTIPDGFRPLYLDFIAPLPKETLEQYAARLAEDIDHSAPFVLVGLSLGGMLAVEIARYNRPVKLILLSTIQCASELPPSYKFASRIGLHRLVPISLLKYGSIIKRLFTLESEADKAYLRKVIRQTDPSFIRWAMNAILKWKNNKPPEHCLHIHGTADEILPIKYTRPTHAIYGGEHLMVLTRAKEISSIMKECLVKK